MFLNAQQRSQQVDGAPHELLLRGAFIRQRVTRLVVGQLSLPRHALHERKRFPGTADVTGHLRSADHTSKHSSGQHESIGRGCEGPSEVTKEILLVRTLSESEKRLHGTGAVLGDAQQAMIARPGQLGVTLGTIPEYTPPFTGHRCSAVVKAVRREWRSEV